MTRLLLSDHHELFRTAVRALLAAAEDLEVVGEAGSVDETWERLGELVPELLVLDANMPGAGATRILEELRSRRPALRVLVLTDHPEDAFALRCLRSGALGYLTKDHASEDLLAAVRKVASGRKYVSLPLAERLATDLARRAPGLEPHAALSPRELQVLRSLARSQSVSEIARELGLSPKTVSTYRCRILEKLGLRSTAEVMLYAIEKRLVEPLRKPPADD